MHFHARGEITLEFDGSDWVLLEGVEELTDEVLKNGICFKADANARMGMVLENTVPDELVTYPIRFSLFKHCRRVIRIAEKAGVTRALVLGSTFNVPGPSRIRRRHRLIQAVFSWRGCMAGLA